MSTIALVRRPTPNLDDGLVEHIEKVPVDFTKAMKQWENYVSALNDAGWQTLEVPEAADCPDAVFVEDSVVVYKNVAISTRPGAPTRRGEVAGTRQVLSDLRFSLGDIREPETLEGGDVLKVGNTIYVGRGDRTNAEGVAALRAALSPLGAKVVAVPVTKVLHLKTAVTALPDGTIIGYPDFVDDTSIFPNFTAVSEPHGTAVVCLSNDHLLMSAAAPETAKMWQSRGYKVTCVDISEFEKLEGCVTCLSVRLRDVA